MVKVTIGGETFSFDEARYPLTEAIELEDALGMPFGEWQRLLRLGGAKAVAGYVWLVLKRNGRDVPLADILSGEFPLDTADIDIEAEGGTEGPTGSPAASAGDSGNGSAPSPKPTGTPPLTSVASPPMSSTTL